MQFAGGRRPARRLLGAVEARRERLRALARRTRQVLLLAAVTGALTGLAVAAFERLTADVLLDAVLRAPLAVQIAAPAAGLAIAVAVLGLRRPRVSPSTSDEYIKSFHDHGGRLSPDDPLESAMRAMDAAGVDRLAVCADGRFVGVITASGLVALHELLDRDEGA